MDENNLESHEDLNNPLIPGENKKILSQLATYNKNQNRNFNNISNRNKYLEEDIDEAEIEIEVQNNYIGSYIENQKNNKSKLINNDDMIYEYNDIENKVSHIDIGLQSENNENLNNTKNVNKKNFINKMRILTHDSMENYMEPNKDLLFENQIEFQEQNLEEEQDQEEVFLENEKFYKMNERKYYKSEKNFNNKSNEIDFEAQYANSKNAMFNKTLNFNPSNFNKNFFNQNFEIKVCTNNKTENNDIYLEQSNNNENNNPNLSQSDSLPVLFCSIKILNLTFTFKFL